MTIQHLRRLLAPFILMFCVGLGACTSGPPASELNDGADSGLIEDASVTTDSGDATYDGDQDTGRDISPDAAPDASPDAARDASPDTSPDAAPDTSPDAEVLPDPIIKVATFNVRFLFDTECDSGFCGPDDFEEAPTQAEFNARLDEVAQAIESLDADVVLLQEIENQSVLDALNAALTKPYAIAELAETGYRASLDVAVLARGALIDTREYEDLNGGFQTFTRTFLRVDLELHGERAIVFSAHFKSKHNDNPARRMAEAQTARDIVTGIASTHDGALIILGGDLNDTPNSQPLLAMTADGELVRVAEDEALEDVYTYVYNWEQQEIDHLLLAPTRGGAYIDDSARSVHGGQPPGLGGSDHGALVARFEMR